ncbi:hypothetical protein CL617_02585 [archaeon]|jgi:hypothetical protein|nr:hypothetical protein [archaeon]|tara:strand:+ start:1707 stop:2129 length:423 start_codon:yes stop_codon:yes gene_type:complete
MNFKNFIEKGQVRKASKDIQLAKSLIDTADSDLIFFKKIEINKISARKVMTNYYDILRSILEATAALEGYKIYSHEAFTYFLIEKNETLISQKFDRFRKIRNGINYYGKNISPEETKENIVEIVKLINVLKKRYLIKNEL